VKARAAVVKFSQRQTDIFEFIDAILPRFVPKTLEDYVTSMPLRLGSGAYCDRRYWNKRVNRRQVSGASKQTVSRVCKAEDCCRLDYDVESTQSEFRDRWKNMGSRGETEREQL
jgi:hypothetical protein